MKKKRKLKLWVKVFLFSFFLLSIALLTNHYLPKKEKKEFKKEETITPQKKESKLSLIMVGDNLIHDKIYNEAKTNEGYDFTKMYEKIKPIIKEYDLAYYNQETILGGSEIGVSSYPSFNSPYEVGDAMIDAGFNLVSLATNHTLDRGETAIINSRNYWNQHKDILAVGSYSSFEERDTPVIKEKNNITYTLLNYTYGTNGIAVPSGKEYLVNIWPVTGSNPETDTKYQNYKEQIKKDIEKVKDKVDVIMVAMHWGIEYEHNPNAYQKDMAEYLSNLGVNIIIGTHPHVIEPITWINNTLVIYSLGNFLSAHEVVNLANRIGLMTSVDIIKEENKITITNLNNELLYTYYEPGYHNFKIIPFSNMKEEYLTNYKNIYEEYKNIVQKLDNSIKVNPYSQ